MRVVVPALVVPVADDASSEDQQRDERQGNAQDLDRFSQNGFGPVQSRSVSYGLGNLNLMWDVRKALPVSRRREGNKPVGQALACRFPQVPGREVAATLL